MEYRGGLQFVPSFLIECCAIKILHLFMVTNINILMLNTTSDVQYQKGSPLTVFSFFALV